LGDVLAGCVRGAVTLYLVISREWAHPAGRLDSDVQALGVDGLMDGYGRLDLAARKKGWKVSRRSNSDQIFTLRNDVIIEVWFTGCIVHSALMLTNDSEQRLTPKDRDKAARIEAVLLGNSTSL
jgi:hypothetical protein